MIVTDYMLLFFTLIMLGIFIFKMRPAYRILQKKAFLGEVVINFTSLFDFSWVIPLGLFIWTSYTICCREEKAPLSQYEIYNLVILAIGLLIDLYYSMQRKTICSKGILDPATGAWFWEEIETYSMSRDETNYKRRKNKLPLMIPKGSVFGGSKEAVFQFDDKMLPQVRAVLDEMLAGKEVDPPEGRNGVAL